jgi:hypothetical protein
LGSFWVFIASTGCFSHYFNIDKWRWLGGGLTIPTLEQPTNTLDNIIGCKLIMQDIMPHTFVALGLHFVIFASGLSQGA